MTEYGIYNTGIFWELYIPPNTAYAFISIEDLAKELFK
jgi:hypothetical protein